MAKQAMKRDGKKMGKKAAKAKAAVTANVKANGSPSRKPAGIVAFMLEKLQEQPITVKALAEAAHTQFPDHRLEALTNTCRGVLARITKHGFRAEHDAKAKTYQISPVAK